jgi:hypothetical protein
MISSLLSMANNALIYTHKPVARAGGAVPPVNGPSYQDEQEVRENESRHVSETRPAAQEDRFSESLASRLRETGLTGPDSSGKIGEVTAKAREVVSQIRREDGASEANRAMAQILTSATGENADAVLSGIAARHSVPTQGKNPLPGEEEIPEETASRTPQDLQESAAEPSADEVARRAADLAAEKAAKSQAVPPASSGTRDTASAVRSALDEIEAFSPQAAKADAEGKFFSMVNKAEAQGVAAAASSYGAYGSGGYGAYGQPGSSVPPAYQAAYSGRLPNPGSLLSVRV